MAEEISEAFNLSYGLLAADAQLQAVAGGATNPRIYQEAAPPYQGLYILGSFMAGHDVVGMRGVRLMSEPLLLWRAVQKGQLTPALRTADARMDAVLTNVRARVSGGYSLSFVRERPYRRSYYDSANNLFSESGGYYRCYVSAN